MRNRVVLVMCMLFAATGVVVAGSAASQPSFVTNWEEWSSKRISLSKLPPPQHVYDVSIAAYTKEFADKYGLVPEYVESLDAGMLYLEVRILTEGRKTNCYFDFILDGSVDIDFPQHNMVRTGGVGMQMPFIKKEALSDAQEKALNDVRLLRKWKDWAPWQNDLYLGSTSVKGRTNHAGGGVMLVHVLNDWFPDGRTFRIREPCSGLTYSTFKTADPAIWVKKASGEDYTQWFALRKDEFYHFHFPRRMIDELLPLLKEIPHASYTYHD